MHTLSTRKIIRLLVLFIFLYTTVILFYYFNQTALIFYPDRTNFEDCDEFQHAEKISWKTARGYFTDRGQDKMIIFYSGNAGRVCDRSYFDSIFAGRNYSTFFVEYSGYGEENNRPSKEKILNNVIDIIDFLADKNYTEKIIMSESLGSGPASYHAKHGDIQKLVMITPFNDLASVGFHHFPFFPVRTLLRHNFDPASYLQGFTGKVSIIAAEGDKVVPPKFAFKLFDSLTTDYKTIHLIPDVDHNYLFTSDDFFNVLFDTI